LGYPVLQVGGVSKIETTKYAFLRRKPVLYILGNTVFYYAM
jgi:hypothetical protein